MTPATEKQIEFAAALHTRLMSATVVATKKITRIYNPAAALQSKQSMASEWLDEIKTGKASIHGASGYIDQMLAWVKIYRV